MLTLPYVSTSILLNEFTSSPVTVSKAPEELPCITTVPMPSGCSRILPLLPEEVLIAPFDGIVMLPVAPLKTHVLPLELIITLLPTAGTILPRAILPVVDMLLLPKLPKNVATLALPYAAGNPVN